MSIFLKQYCVSSTNTMHLKKKLLFNGHLSRLHLMSSRYYDAIASAMVIGRHILNANLMCG